jgi:hypothetical protein
VQPRGTAARKRPYREAGVTARTAADPWVLRRRSAQEVVGGNPECSGKRRHMIKSEAPLAGLQSAEGRNVDRCASRYLRQREPSLGSQLAQPASDSSLDWLRRG